MNKNTESGYKKIKWRFGKEIEIPEEWDCCTLQKLCCKLKSGGTPKSDQNEYYDGDIPFASIKDITSSEKYLTKTIKTITKKGLVNSNAWIIPKNSLLYSMYATVGKPIINKIDTTTHQGILGILVDEKKLNNEFLYYVLRYIQPILIRYFLTNTQSNINLEISKNLEILHPKKTYEQQKIASILSGVDALIESTQKIIWNAEKLKKGLMRQLLTRGINHKKFQRVKWLFGKEIEIPEEWKCVILDRLTPLNEKSSIRMGPFGSSLKKHELLDSGEIKTLWIENIVTDKFVWKYQKFITKEKYEQLKGFTVKPNDLLMTMMGTLGKTAIVPSDIGTSIISSHLLKITPESKKLTSKFLYYFLKSPFIQKQIIKESHGLVMGGLNTGIIKKLLINTPPINEQQKIASILSGVDAYIQKNQQYKERLEKLKKGLMQKLLTGQIRVKV